jgi:hypothetical protein
MCNEHRPAAQIVGDGTDIADLVNDGTCVKPLVSGAGAVSAQAQGDRAIAGTGKEVQEVVPTRRGMPTAVHEKQRYRMGFAPGPLVDHLEHELIIRQRRRTRSRLGVMPSVTPAWLSTLSATLA